MTQRELYLDFFDDDEWLEMLIHIESGEILEAIRCLRSKTGYDMVGGAKAVKKICMEEFNREIISSIKLVK